MNILILGPDFTEDITICDLGALGDFVPVNEKKGLVPLMYPIPWKRSPILLDIPFIHLRLSGPLKRCWY